MLMIEELHRTTPLFLFFKTNLFKLLLYIYVYSVIYGTVQYLVDSRQQIFIIIINSVADSRRYYDCRYILDHSEDTALLLLFFFYNVLFYIYVIN